MVATGGSDGEPPAEMPVALGEATVGRVHKVGELKEHSSNGFVYKLATLCEAHAILEGAWLRFYDPIGLMRGPTAVRDFLADAMSYINDQIRDTLRPDGWGE